MRPILQSVPTAHTPESLVDQLAGERGVGLLRSSYFDSPQARYSFVAARPLLTFRSYGSRCELDGAGGARFGNPWQTLEELMARYELLDEIDLPFPLGGCFGYWGYELKNFRRTAPAANSGQRSGIARLPCRILRQPGRVRSSPGQNVDRFDGIASRTVRATPARARAQFDFWAGQSGVALSPARAGWRRCGFVPFTRICRGRIHVPKCGGRRNTSARATFIRRTFRIG